LVLGDFWAGNQNENKKFCPVLDIQEPLTDFHVDKAIFFFLKKKVQIGGIKKQEFFEIANSQKNFVKILQIGPWISRID
jgi:hypothetical protein